MKTTIDCKHYYPAWAGNKTSGTQPDWCMKLRMTLCGKCIKNCKHYAKSEK